MAPLSRDDLHVLRAARQKMPAAGAVAQTDIDRLVADWSPRVQPDGKDASEDFAVVLPDGSPTRATGPRWLFHLLGLPHPAAHVGLVTSGGLVVLQRRAPTKADWPDAWDMAVAGHVPAGMSYLEGALKETEEEIGLPPTDLPAMLVEGGLVQVGMPFTTFEMDEQRNPPFYNAEVQQLFAGTLTAEGLDRLRPCPEELAGIYLCPPEEAWDILARDTVAGGLRTSLPRFLDWLAQRSDAASSVPT